MENKVAMSSDFLTSFSRLPKGVQGKVTDFVNKFRCNPNSNGINYEKIEGCPDKKIFSVRIDETYRGIVMRQHETGTYVILWVDHHDEAYAWAKNKRCEVNPNTGVLQVYGVDESAQSVSNTLFSSLTEAQLLELGVPSLQIHLVLSIKDKDELIKSEGILPYDVYEYLSLIADDIPYDEVLDLARDDRTENKNIENISDALDAPSTMKSFVVIEGEDELRKIMAEPLEKWRVFLHPTQRKIVRKTYNGPARVLGGAGTGKTVVAMHRAKYLASLCDDNEKVLFTTFTSNLAMDINENLRKICTTDELKKIEAVNLDSWVSQYMKKNGFSTQIVYDEELDNLWRKALDSTNPEYDLQFYKDEWAAVIVPQEAFTLNKYLAASRAGRGVALYRKQRKDVWKTIEEFINILVENNKRDINYAMYDCREMLRSDTGHRLYKNVIVDEGQDFGNSAYKLIRAIVGDERENDIFIVGDSHQRIYKNYPTLSKCGINIKGRSSVLRINYRTTEEIRKAAFALLEGVHFDDLDGGNYLMDGCRSLIHGDGPKVYNFGNSNKEAEFIVSEIHKLNDSGVSLSDICVVVRQKKAIDSYISFFKSNGISSYEIKRSKVDDQSHYGVRMATMHRVKGLEFRYVFIASANDNILPLHSVISTSDQTSKDEAIISEKCLLYVAMTRARNALYITSYGNPSVFLECIGDINKCI